MYLFLGVIKHIDVPGDARCITIVGENLGGNFDNVESVDTSVTQLEIIHGRLGGDVSIDGLGVSDIKYPCVLDGVNDEGVTATFSSFLQIEIVPKRFLDGIREGADSKSGVVGYYRVEDVPFGRGENFVL